jgi:uncharacterized membrane protein
MKRLNEFFKTSLIGGIVVILPVAILVFLFKWVFGFVTNLIQPLTNIIMKITVQSRIQELLADFTAIAVIVAACFAVGVFVRTKVGTYLYHNIEHRILKAAPGYSLIKETVIQFLGNKKTPFSKVALVQIFANETLVSAFITDEHDDGHYTVFVPTGPNPTSGNIFHVKGKYVHPVNVPVEDAMRSIISCGAGSASLIKNHMEKSGAVDDQSRG